MCNINIELETWEVRSCCSLCSQLELKIACCDHIVARYQLNILQWKHLKNIKKISSNAWVIQWAVCHWYSFFFFYVFEVIKPHIQYVQSMRWHCLQEHCCPALFCQHRMYFVFYPRQGSLTFLGNWETLLAYWLMWKGYQFDPHFWHNKWAQIIFRIMLSLKNNYINWPMWTHW